MRPDTGKTLIAAIFTLAIGLVVFTPSAAAHCHKGFGDCSTGFGNDYDRGYDRGYSSGGSMWTSDYQRGGLAHDYFHTDQFFGREIRGFPDTAFGEDSQYDRVSKHASPRERGQYNQRYDSGRYGAFSGLSLRYGEGFVSGEGFGDEYIGDPDQLDEEIFLFD
jgi:hypothetical protein